MKSQKSSCANIDEFEQFWNRNEELLLKFCDLYKTDKDGFKVHIYDEWEEHGLISEIEKKLEKIYKQTKVAIYLYGDKRIKVEKISFHE